MRISPLPPFDRRTMKGCARVESERSCKELFLRILLVTPLQWVLKASGRVCCSGAWFVKKGRRWKGGMEVGVGENGRSGNGSGKGGDGDG